MRKLKSLLLVASCLVAITAAAQSSGNSKPVYDGTWWLSAPHDRQSGFLEGVADCLTWAVREKGFNGTSDQLQDKITAYYKNHPARKTMLVTEVWQEVWHTPGESKPSDVETWKNPHWYLNGLWWRQGSRDEQKGFLEGYLWCVRSRLSSGPRDYALSNEHYFNKLDQYIQSHPGADDTPVATTLSRFSDTTGVGSKRNRRF
jgi:hypothetical protein